MIKKEYVVIFLLYVFLLDLWFWFIIFLIITRNGDAKNEEKVTMWGERRDLEIGTPVSSFVSREGRVSRSSSANAETRRIGRRSGMNATYIPDDSDSSWELNRVWNISLPSRARGDFRSIKVTSISCLIRSRSKSQRDASRFFIAWRLINGNSQMLGLHIFLDYFKNARYMATRLTLVADELSIADVAFNNLIIFREIFLKTYEICFFN